MDTLTIVVVLALIATVVTMLLGVFSMGTGGDVDKYAGERLMWARIVLQGIAALLMIVALVIR
jgi:hypothetical protein